MMRAFVIFTLALACVFFLVFGALSHFPRLVEIDLFSTQAQWLSISAYRGRVWLLHNQDVSSRPPPPPAPLPALPLPTNPTTPPMRMVIPPNPNGPNAPIPSPPKALDGRNVDPAALQKWLAQMAVFPPAPAPNTSTFDWTIIKFSSARHGPLQVTLLRFPFWLPSGLLLAVLFLLAGVPWLRRRYRRRRGLCLRCAYDLTGNETGICPECGTEGTREMKADNRSTISSAVAAQTAQTETVTCSDSDLPPS